MGDQDEIVEATTAESGKIKNITHDVVQKICKSQVIVSLAIACKELVENSVDAGAKVVQVKLQDHGQELVEVIDNGSGVLEKDFAGLCAFHHTSKLKDFEDLESIGTFGFRGEALSSLCAFSEMTIITRHATSLHATKLEFDREGQVTKQSIAARDVGTTVSLRKLFNNLPVRKMQFQKNAKAEFQKTILLLQEYCLMLTGTRLILSNRYNEKRTVCLDTNGKSVIDNITCVFTSKQSQSLLEIKSPIDASGNYSQKSLIEEAKECLDISRNSIDRMNKLSFKVEGYISKIQHGCGRATKDRQYFYLNNRPVVQKNIMKLVNDVYRQYNSNEWPFFYLNLTIAQSDLDINLTPDKRAVLIKDEKVVQLAVKRALLNTFGVEPGKLHIMNINRSVKNHPKNPSKSDTEDEEDEIIVMPPSYNFPHALKMFKGNSSFGSSNKRKSSSSPNENSLKIPKIDKFFTQSSLSALDFSNIPSEEAIENINDSNTIEIYTPPLSLGRSQITRTNIDSGNVDRRENSDATIVCKTQTDSRKSLKFIAKESYPVEVFSPTTKSQTSHEKSDLFDDLKTPEFVDVDKYVPNKSFLCKKLQTTIEELETMVLEENILEYEIKNQDAIKKLKFKAKIDPNKNKHAEKELETEIKKDMFEKMTVIGQFNKGFILTRLDDNLFIIDQHATDEKFNYERLERETVLEVQHLVCPESLDLSASNELLLLDHLEIFEWNGFKFSIDHNSLPTKKVRLVAKPKSKNCIFGKKDIDELLFMLSESPESTQIRTPAIRAMLASRACRSSVMIGTSLTKGKMRTLIDNMGKIEHPWNCPHGRPTIRFLANLFLTNVK